MAEAQSTPATEKKAPAAPLDLTQKRALRSKLRAASRKKLAAKLVADKEFAKAYFGAKSKRATDKKAAFRKKKSKKK